MKKILCSCFLIIFIHISFAQIINPNHKSVYFSYDEAGNQILREANSLEISKNSNEKSISIFNDEISPEDLFFEQINFFPIPVIENLTIKWTNEINGEIFSFGIYDHNQLSYFYKENSKSLNGQIDINMTSYKSGIYIIQFTLTDGRIYAKSIIKK